MKKHLSTIIACIACLGVVICLFQISNLKLHIENQEGYYESRISNMEDNNNNMRSYFEQKLTEQASLLASSDWSYADHDIDARTVQLFCSVTPKEHSPGVTEAYLTVNGKEVPMELENGEYVLKTDIPIFESTSVSKVVFIENDIARTEVLDWFLSPKSEYIPVMFTDFSGSGHGRISSKKANTYVWHREGEFNIHIECYERQFEVESITLVEVIDGIETARTNIPLNTDSYDEEMVTEMEAVMDDNYNGSYYHFYHQLERDFEIPFGSTMDLYVELVDDSGFIYRNCVEHWEIDSHGEPVDTDDWYYTGMEASIYDNKGNILFVPEIY